MVLSEKIAKSVFNSALWLAGIQYQVVYSDQKATCLFSSETTAIPIA
jgi:hypothetical protein